MPAQRHVLQRQQRRDVRANSMPDAAAGGGSGSSGSSGGGGGGGGSGGGGGGDSGKGGEGEEDDRLLDLAQAEAMAAAARVRLPADMIETARTVGIRSTALSKYISLQVCVWQSGQGKGAGAGHGPRDVCARGVPQVRLCAGLVCDCAHRRHPLNSNSSKYISLQVCLLGKGAGQGMNRGARRRRAPRGAGGGGAVY